MNKQLFDTLTALPSLDRNNRQAVPCKICGGESYVFDVVDFNKSCSEDIYAFGVSGVSIWYFQCVVCGFLFTNFFDEWTSEEFARFVYNADYIKVDGEYAGIRPEREANAMAKRLGGLSNLRILDYGSGSGLFADHLRSQGFDKVSSYDPFSSPNRPRDKFEIITCFEVLEHTTSPRSTVADLVSFLDPKGCVIFSTGIQPPSIDEIRANWWYVGPRNGHVSIYSLNALARLGQEVGLVLNVGPGGTAFAGRCVSPESEQLLLQIGRPFRMVQLTAPDDGDVMMAEQKSSWHGVEGAGVDSFRWTREAEIIWRIQSQPLQQCELQIAIPIQNEIQQGFANRCRVEIGSKSALLKRNIRSLTASISIEKPEEPIIKLVMPNLLRPCDLGTVSDRRPLGLAISTTSAVEDCGIAIR